MKITDEGNLTYKPGKLKKTWHDNVTSAYEKIYEVSSMNVIIFYFRSWMLKKHPKLNRKIEM